jgi:hypothetical protein
MIPTLVPCIFYSTRRRGRARVSEFRVIRVGFTLTSPAPPNRFYADGSQAQSSHEKEGKRSYSAMKCLAKKNCEKVAFLKYYQ